MTELLELLTDPSHLAFEAITDLFAFAVGAVWHSVWVKRHDRKVHPVLNHEAAELLAYWDIDPEQGSRQARLTELHEDCGGQ